MAAISGLTLVSGSSASLFGSGCFVSSRFGQAVGGTVPALGSFKSRTSRCAGGGAGDFASAVTGADP